MTGRAKAGIPSEAVEPFAAFLIGRLFAACEAERKEETTQNGFLHACGNLWSAVMGLQKISVAIPEACHFSIALMNNIRFIANYIEDHTGMDPDTEPFFGGRPR